MSVETLISLLQQQPDPKAEVRVRIWFHGHDNAELVEIKSVEADYAPHNVTIMLNQT